ncbi:hypothetical protein GGU10DRAFT_391324, partial [Lentinula aff. detonsa]
MEIFIYLPGNSVIDVVAFCLFIDDQFGDRSLVRFQTTLLQLAGHRVQHVLDADFTQMLHKHSTKLGMILHIIQRTKLGTSLDVFCIIPNPSDPNLTSTYNNLTFELDGQPLGETSTLISDSTNVFQFNVSVLSLENLSLAPHIFTMMAASKIVDSTLQFDYAMYTTPNSLDPSSTPSVTPSISPSPSSTSTQRPAVAAIAIAGAAVGGSLFLILTIAFIFWYLRHKRRG